MRPALPAKLVGAAAGVMLLGGIAAQASEATLLAERGGFLLGHAHRCGIEDGRLKRAKAVLDQAIGAFSLDEQDKDAAQSQFNEQILTSALADLLGDRLPGCAVVRSELAQFERHRMDPAPTPSGRSGRHIANSATVAKPAKSVRPGAITPAAAPLLLCAAAPARGCLPPI